MSFDVLRFGLRCSAFCLVLGCSSDEPSSDDTDQMGTLTPGPNPGPSTPNESPNASGTPTQPSPSGNDTGAPTGSPSPSETGGPSTGPASPNNTGSGPGPDPVDTGGGPGTSSPNPTDVPGSGGTPGNPPVEQPGGTGGTPGNEPSGSGGADTNPPVNPDVDQNGKSNAKPGEMTNVNQDYLKFGEVRILNNNWGSAELGCNDSSFSVFVNQDRSFGWTFGRGTCGGMGSKPDFPQIEFGIHPFGIGNVLVTSPEFSSTTLLPLQIKDIQSASVNVNNMNISFQEQSSWNITFEFWLSQQDPRTSGDAGVYAELMTFWGWQDGRWPSPPNGTGPLGEGAGTDISSGGKSYKLWVQRDDWADGKWRYFQFRDNNGPNTNFNGTLDVKPFLDYLVQQRGYSTDLWVTRLEVGSEIDDRTRGTVTLQGITFEVNGQSRAAIVAD